MRLQGDGDEAGEISSNAICNAFAILHFPLSTRASDHIDLTADATLGVDDLAAMTRTHARTEATLAGSFDFADSAFVMHDSLG
jgi:hypothetical protein